MPPRRSRWPTTRFVIAFESRSDLVRLPWSGVRDASMGPMFVAVPLVLARYVQQVGLVPHERARIVSNIAGYLPSRSRIRNRVKGFSARFAPAGAALPAGAAAPRSLPLLRPEPDHIRAQRPRASRPSRHRTDHHDHQPARQASTQLTQPVRELAPFRVRGRSTQDLPNDHDGRSSTRRWPARGPRQ